MMKKIIFITLLFIPLCGFAQQKWTLQQCVDTALVHNWNVKKYDLSSQSKKISYDQSRQNLLPSVNASVGQNFNYGRSLTVNNVYESTNSTQTSLGVSANVTLFDGLKMKYNIEARNADLKASYAEKQLQQDNVKVNVSQAYLQVLLDKELLRIANDQLALTQSKIEMQKSLVANGKLAEGEVYSLQAQAGKEELNRTRADNTLKLDLLILAQIMVVNVENFDVDVPENFPEQELQLISAEAIYLSAITHRPEIKGAEYRLLSSQKDVLVNKATAYPTLSFGANTGSGYYNMSNNLNSPFSDQLKNNWSSSLGFTLSIPIFNKFQIHNSVKQAQLAVESSKVDLSMAKDDLKKSIQQAYFNAVAAKARWEAAQKSEVAAKEAYRFANQKYESGRASLYDLYQAKSDLTQVLSEKSQAKFEYIFRMKLLELLK